MTTNNAPTVQIATVPAADLMRAITNAVLAASTDDTLPSICAIHFRPGHEPGTLMLEATNRYIASQEHIDLADLLCVKGNLPHDHFIYHGSGFGDEQERDRRKQLTEHLFTHEDHRYDFTSEAEYDFTPYSTDEIAVLHEAKHGLPRPTPETELDALVNAKDLAKLVRTLKLEIEPETRNATGPDAPHVVIEHRPDADGFTGKISFTLVNNNGSETSVTRKAVYGDYAKIDTLMVGAEAAAANSVVTKGSFNPDYLAILTKVDPGEKNITVDIQFTGDGKPALFTVGQRYRALLVPIRKR